MTDNPTRAKALIKDMEAYFGAGREHECHNEGSGDGNSLQIAPPSGQIRPALRGKPEPEIQEALLP